MGVGEGRYEPLKKIAFHNNRIIRIESFNQLNLGQVGNKNSQIFDVINDPNKSVYFSLSNFVLTILCVLSNLIYRQDND